MVRKLSGKIVTPPLDAAAAADQAWLAAHPERDFLLRDPAPLEFKEPLGEAGEGYSWRVLVVRLDAGGRLRLPVSLAWDLHNDHANDRRLSVLFEQVAPPQAKTLYAEALAKRPPPVVN